MNHPTDSWVSSAALPHPTTPRGPRKSSLPAYEPLAEAVATPTLDVVIPVYNEEADLEASVLRVRERLASLPWSHRITIADNASTDGTAVLALSAMVTRWLQGSAANCSRTRSTEASRPASSL